MFAIDRQEAWTLSPMNSENLVAVCRLRQHTEIVVAVAENDSPPFREQSQQFVQVCESNATFI